MRFINCFEVPVGRDEEFLELWGTVNEYMQGKPGYVGHRLHRALSADARYRYVNYVEWASREDWAAAHDSGFRELVGLPGWEPFTTTPALYEVVHAAGTISDDDPTATITGEEPTAVIENAAENDAAENDAATALTR